MFTFFAFLFVIFLGGLIFGLAKPDLFSRLIKRNLSRKQIGIFLGAATITSLIIAGAIAPAKEQQVVSNSGGSVQTSTQNIETKQVKENVAVAFQYQNEDDPTLEKGQTKLKQAGQNGTKEHTFKVTLTDGKQTGKELVSEVVTVQPVTQITSVGTKEPTAAPAPQPAPTPAPAPAPQPDHPAGATALCNDGTYSYAANHQGACSHHGGVAQWYK